MAEVAPLIRRPVHLEPNCSYREIGIRSFGKGTFHKPPATGLEIGEKKVFAIEPGDLLFNIVFAWEGAVAVASEDERGMIGSHRFLTCVADSRLADAQYLYWYFIEGRGLKQLQIASPGGAGRNRTLGVDKLAAIMLDLPPIEEQRRVAKKLGTAVSKIAALRQSAERTRQEFRATLDSAFHKSIGGALRVAMGEIAPIVRRPIEIDPDKTYTEIGVRSFYKGLFHRRTVQGSQFTWQKLFRIAEDDLVFSNLMAWERAIALATAADEGCVGNHRMLTCEADRTRCLPIFLWYYFRTPEGLAQVVAASPGSIARNKTLSAELLAKIAVPVPSLDAQEWFAALHTKAHSVELGRADVDRALSGLVPSLLNHALD